MAPGSDPPLVLQTMAGARRLTGLTNRQLRYYDRCGLVVPLRSSGNHRLYRPEDIERLLLVRDLLRSGLRVAEAARRLPPPP